MSVTNSTEGVHFFDLTNVLKDSVVRLKFVRETCASRLPPPMESGSVAVVDGGDNCLIRDGKFLAYQHVRSENILITPFSVQNVPPPISSYFIKLGQSNQEASGGLPITNTPTHITLSHCADLLAILYNDGVVEVWNLGTNLTPPHSHKGKREEYKVARPTNIWRRPLAEDVTGRLSPRQVVLFRRNITITVNEDWGLAILSTLTEGTIIKDVILLYFSDGERFTVALQTCGSGSLIAAPVGVWFEDFEGGFHEGMALFKAIPLTRGLILTCGLNLIS